MRTRRQNRMLLAGYQTMVPAIRAEYGVCLNVWTSRRSSTAWTLRTKRHLKKRGGLLLLWRRAGSPETAYCFDTNQWA